MVFSHILRTDDVRGLAFHGIVHDERYVLTDMRTTPDAR